MPDFPTRFTSGQKPFLIAELSGNHNGDIDRAKLSDGCSLSRISGGRDGGHGDHRTPSNE